MTMNKSRLPLVSIITVCKNSSDLLERTIESVKKQTYDNLEYVIIDGKSTDSTGEILNKYNNTIDICISEDDDGIYSAMNKGIKKSHGEIVLFLNAGDYYSSSNIIQLFANKFNETNADIVYGKMEEIDDVTNSNRVVGVERASRYYWFKYTIPHPSIAYRSDLFKKYGFYDESYRFAADYDVNLRFFFNKSLKKKFLDKITTVFHRGGASTNSNTKNVVISERKIIQKNHFNSFERLVWGVKLIRRIF